MTQGKISAGKPYPLGASFDGKGVNFALFSAHAQKVFLCLVKDGEVTDIPITTCTDHVWHVYVADEKLGSTYAFRVFGDNTQGGKFVPERLLLDPYAKDFCGDFSYQDISQNTVHGLLAKVSGGSFDWEGDAPPKIPLAQSVFYEIHVKGATISHPEVPEKLCGTYAGLASDAMIAHFQKLGVTALNLLPVQGFIDEQRLAHHCLTNYWGYNTLFFFAPEPRYASGHQGQSVKDEFCQMVKTLHKAGIEVILDVVYNHTAETDEFGPTLSFRGIDNASYYKLPPDNLYAYLNYSGCGNTFNVTHPRVLQLVMDSLRYWVSEMHVDGFRFDLAAALARDSAFLDAILQDPVLSEVKLIAEPWDLGMDGYRLGRFHAGWSEWNDRFRDDVRAFWLTGEVGIGALAQRICGSSEIFNQNGRSPLAGVNFITAHDGFTLHDLVSYRGKHNEANGENNRDGNNTNLSTNCGTEGDTQDEGIVAKRTRLKKALIATLFLSRGLPMFQGGDEISRTQKGNNNAYCQDNEITWLNWQDVKENTNGDLVDFVSKMADLRLRYPQISPPLWLTGDLKHNGVRDIIWWHYEGREMRPEDWQHPSLLGFLLSPLLSAPASETLLILINRYAEDAVFQLPEGTWQVLCISSENEPFSTKTLVREARLFGECVLIASKC